MSFDCFRGRPQTKMGWFIQIVDCILMSHEDNKETDVDQSQWKQGELDCKKLLLGS